MTLTRRTCHLCGRVGSQQFVAVRDMSGSWRCMNRDACRDRRLASSHAELASRTEEKR